MKYIVSYLAAVSLSDLLVVCFDPLGTIPPAGEYSDLESVEDNTTSPPALVKYIVNYALSETPLLNFLNTLNLTMPVLKVISPKGFKLVFEDGKYLLRINKYILYII